MPMFLKKGAILIADAHYPNHNKSLVDILKALDSAKLQSPQLILMGDIFDLLVGGSSYLKKLFNSEIELIDKLAKKIEVIYIEGNHDFNLQPLFKNVKIFKIEQQPAIFKFGTKTAALSHGDKYQMNLSYKIYTKIIRNPIILKLLPEFIAKNKLASMRNKKICKKIKNFDNLAKNILKNYKADMVIEGHYHQGVIIDNYISLPSLACSGKVAVFNGESIEFKKLAL